MINNYKAKLQEMVKNPYLNNRLNMNNQLDLKNFNIDKKDFNYYLKNYLKLKNDERTMFSIYCLSSNINKELNLTKENIDFLIKNADLKLLTFSQLNIISIIFTHNKRQNLNINSEQFDYLIENSKLDIDSSLSGTPLSYAIIYNQLENLNLKSPQISKIFEKSIKNKKVETFYKSLVK